MVPFTLHLRYCFQAQLIGDGKRLTRVYMLLILSLWHHSIYFYLVSKHIWKLNKIIFVRPLHLSSIIIPWLLHTREFICLFSKRAKEEELLVFTASVIIRISLCSQRVKPWQGSQQLLLRCQKTVCIIKQPTASTLHIHILAHTKTRVWITEIVDIRQLCWLGSPIDLPLSTCSLTCVVIGRRLECLLFNRGSLDGSHLSVSNHVTAHNSFTISHFLDEQIKD